MTNEIIKERMMYNLRMNISDNFYEDGYTGLYEIYIENGENYGLCIHDKYIDDDVSRSVMTKMLALYDAVRYEIPTSEYIETKVDVDLYGHTDILLIIGDTIIFRDGMNTWNFVWNSVEELADYLFDVYTQICVQINSKLTLVELLVLQDHIDNTSLCYCRFAKSHNCPDCTNISTKLDRMIRGNIYD